MNIVPILIVAFATGILTKIVDLHHDNNLRLPYYLNTVFGGLYGFLIALMISFVPEVAPLWIGATVGVIAVGKIDSVGHYLGAASIFLFVGLFGIPLINIFFLLAFTIFSLLDEVFNSNLTEKIVKKKIVKKIFSFRPFLELSAFIISILTGVWIIWLSIFLFDIAYILTSHFGMKFIKIEWVEV